MQFYIIKAYIWVIVPFYDLYHLSLSNNPTKKLYHSVASEAQHEPKEGRKAPRLWLYFFFVQTQ